MTVTKAVDFGVYEIEHVPDAKTQPEGLKVLDSLLFQSTFPVGLPPGAVTAHVVAFHFESGFGLPEVDVLVGVVSGTAKSGEAMPLLVVGIGVPRLRAHEFARRLLTESHVAGEHR